ncbi:hypothetical protein AVEN_226745-1 [Araneus ventricosus]|uniref:Uncharacterized protein n=1 Tax=Araneus ventricosus TaxID=182803 RepID=A0A4Y2GGF7_ARAVE|nr:hypothetical protein AVEN_226745-1 [Araneus ventricosus]
MPRKIILEGVNERLGSKRRVANQMPGQRQPCNPEKPSKSILSQENPINCNHKQQPAYTVTKIVRRVCSENSPTSRIMENEGFIYEYSGKHETH